MNRPCARYPELPIVRSCKQRRRRSATLFKTFFCCRIFVKFLEGDLIWARIPSSICCGCCLFYSIPSLKKKRKGINPSVEKRSKKRHISFLITSNRSAPFRPTFVRVTFTFSGKSSPRSDGPYHRWAGRGRSSNRRRRRRSGRGRRRW